MSEHLHIEKSDQPEWEIIGGGISEFNESQVGDDHGKNLCYVLKDEQGKVVGGVIGATYWNWLYINLMWLRDDLRGKGYGGELLLKAEAEARQRGADFSYLDTFSFQAPGFYKKFGYEIFGELNEFPPGYQRYFMKKTL